MNRPLLITLALVAGVSIYFGSQGDDDLLAPGKQGGSAQKKMPRETKAAAGEARTAGKASIEPWVAEALTQGVQQWQARTAGLAGMPSGPSPWASMQPPAPPPVKVVVEEPPPPPPPMAPRFPHTWVGRFDDDTTQRAVLAGPQHTWVVHAGDVIDGQWRIDSIQDRRMSLTYLPLQQQQTIAMK